MASMRSRIDSSAGLTGTALRCAVSVAALRCDCFVLGARHVQSVRADRMPGIARSFASTSGWIGASVSISV